MASLQLKFVHLNCIAAVPTVCCVCNTWLWGQLSSQMRVRTLGRWLEMSIRVVEDFFLKMIENAVPRWSCRVSRYISKYFQCDEPFLGQQSSFSESSLTVFLRDAFVFARSCTSDQLCRDQKKTHHFLKSHHFKKKHTHHPFFKHTPPLFLNTHTHTHTTFLDTFFYTPFFYTHTTFLTHFKPQHVNGPCKIALC